MIIIIILRGGKNVLCIVRNIMSCDVWDSILSIRKPIPLQAWTTCPGTYYIRVVPIAPASGIYCLDRVPPIQCTLNFSFLLFQYQLSKCCNLVAVLCVTLFNVAKHNLKHFLRREFPKHRLEFRSFFQ